jgi:HD domain
MTRTIQQLYDLYRIPSGLQLHQLRVAAVGKLVAEAQPQCDVETVITACLLHDMGNIIKFKLDRFPEFLEPEGYEYWAQVQFEYIAQYGWDEHDATEAICHELKVPDAVMECVHSVGLTKVHHNLTEGGVASRATNYSDLRVGPRGLLSIAERHADARVRAGLYHDKQHLTEAEFALIGSDCTQLEKTLTTAQFNPASLTEVTITSLVAELRSFQIIS